MYSDSEIEEELEAEIEEVHKLFPYARFCIDISIKELGDIVVYAQQVAIKCEFNCYCYGEYPRNSEFFICKSDHVITVTDLINCLIQNNFDPGCNHRFLEGFQLRTDAQVEAFFGS